MSTQPEGRGPEEASKDLLRSQATSLKELKQRGGERRRGGQSQEEEKGGGGADLWGQKRWRVQQLEKNKLDMIAANNHEVSGLQAVLTGLRAELERGEVERQSLEYQLALSHRQTDREAERSATLTTHNHTLRERVLQLEEKVSEVEGGLRAREQDQHALLQEVSEAERLKKKAHAQNHRLTQESQQLHSLLKEKEEAFQEQWILRIAGVLESNIEAERAAHIEAKVRRQALEETLLLRV
ncbi:unnamed protein product [Gadus morhua 'NCC']